MKNEMDRYRERKWGDGDGCLIENCWKYIRRSGAAEQDLAGGFFVHF